MLPGQLQPGEAATDHQRGQPLSGVALQSVCKMNGRKLYLQYGSFSSRCGYQSLLHARNQSNMYVHLSNSVCHIKLDPPLLNTHQVNTEFKVINTRRRIKGLYQCCLSSAYSDGNWVQPSKLYNLGFRDGQEHPSKHSTVTRTRAGFKSEDYEITGTDLDSVLSSEETNEVILAEGIGQSNPWWKQFPKRWVMVLLCFGAFLLCNMDRVRFLTYYNPYKYNSWL